jgi:FtsZ-binding cell division protein ZapB
LKLTITYLKEKNVKKEQYAHPMVVEDFIEQIARLQMKIEEMKGEGTQMEEIVREMREGKSYEEVFESRRREEDALMKNQ